MHLQVGCNWDPISDPKIMGPAMSGMASGMIIGITDQIPLHF